MLRTPTCGNGDKDMFVHASELAKAGIAISVKTSLAGLTLYYEMGLGKNNKKQAINIKVVKNNVTNAANHASE